MISEYKTVKIEREGNITFLYFNRPEKRNAMSPQLHLDMDAILEELAVDDETRVLVITGAGEAFSAGQDLKLYFGDDTPVAKRKARNASRSWRWHKLSRFPKPTIAMVNGFCFGGAFSQVCACDFAIAAEDAQFGLSEVNWGTIPGGLVSWNISQILSYRNALYYSITGDMFDGKRAAEIGLVNRAVPKDQLRAVVTDLAEKLLKKNSLAVRFTKEAIRVTRYMNATEAEDYLDAKVDALKHNDKEKGSEKGLKQFLEDKTYKPGFGEYSAADDKTAPAAGKKKKKKD
jgi:trans-feruloyl-CoA hydratase/vanillin synthase